MEIKVVALDLDGTLTNSKKEISLRTKDALLKAMKQGVSVVLASGRPTMGITPLAKELNMKEHGGYILAFNGGKIIDCKTDKVVYENVLPMDCIPTLCEVVKQFGVSMLTYRGNEIICEDDDNPYLLKECFINRTKAHIIEDLAKAVTTPVPKCLILGEHEELLPVKECLEEKFKGKLNIFFSEPYFLEIMPLGIEKAASLDRLLHILKKDRSHLMACGDGLNDLTMLEYAGLGVAMENGCKEAKEIADVITASNDEDGVAVAVEKYILDYEEEVG
ncbi:MAG: Cof-type HAD-IIB family hydrolase [Clostridiales bacterium]|nr:Cof-type HAD-IIB family hydrolase [Clostridiales bacterium]